LQEKIDRDLTALQQSYAVDDDDDNTPDIDSQVTLPLKSPTDWSLLTLDELRKACTDQHMSCTGRQGKLIERLVQYDEAGFEDDRYSFWMLDFLKAECKRRKLPQRGTKQDRID
jgi:hypothetical protein